ncbi:MAG: hypothetical protein ACOCXZ_01145 [Chloroflexota bacterium]
MIATLERLQAYLGLPVDAITPAERARLMAALGAASAQIERLTRRRFTPRRAGLLHDIDPDRPDELLLRDDLLALDTLEDALGVIAPGDVLALPPVGAAGALLVIGGRVFTWSRSPLSAVMVTGVWGWHDDWSNAWRATVDTVMDDPLSAAAATLTVTDADGADSLGELPRFQVGQLLRAGDEYLRVLAVDADTNTLTVSRGANGTTATTHAAGTPLASYQPPPDVVALALRWAGWLYREPDADIGPDGQAVLPTLRAELAGLRRSSVRV